MPLRRIQAPDLSSGFLRKAWQQAPKGIAGEGLEMVPGYCPRPTLQRL